MCNSVYEITNVFYSKALYFGIDKDDRLTSEFESHICRLHKSKQPLIIFGGAMIFFKSFMHTFTKCYHAYRAQKLLVTSYFQQCFYKIIEKNYENS